mmetsp:Transcript_54710/g.61172  ORF Transcript_54710/g.61172 Transcript_54710/m.61172 type:complete len:194 (+) Transcript_54710:249-830(+)
MPWSMGMSPPNRLMISPRWSGKKKTHPTTTTTSESANTIITRAPLEKRVVQLVNTTTNNNGSTSSSSSSSYLYRFAEFNAADTNSSVAIVLQMGALEEVTNATLSLLNALVKEPAFNQLRTEEQLGYIVHVSVKTNGDNIKGLLLLIQSDSFSPDHVEARMELFFCNSIATPSSRCRTTQIFKLLWMRRSRVS